MLTAPRTGETPARWARGFVTPLVRRGRPSGMGTGEYLSQTLPLACTPPPRPPAVVEKRELLLLTAAEPAFCFHMDEEDEPARPPEEEDSADDGGLGILRESTQENVAPAPASNLQKGSKVLTPRVAKLSADQVVH